MENSISKPSKMRLILAAFGSFLLLFSSSFVSNSTSYFIVAVCDYLGCTRAEFSVYYTLVSVFTGIGSVLCGILLPKIGLRKSFLFSSVCVGVGFLIMSRLTALWMVYAGAILIGFGQAFILAAPVKVVNDWFPKEYNGLVMGITMAGTGAGGIVLAQVMPRVVANVSWRTGYLVSLAGFVICSVVANILCGGKAPQWETEAPVKEETKKVNKDAGYWKKVFSAAFILYLLACVLKCFASVFNQHFSAHLQENFTVEQVATVMTVFNVALVIMKISQGALYEKLGYKKLLILVFATSLFYFGWTSTNFTVVCIATVFVMFCCSTETVAYPLFLTEMYGKEFSSAAWGIAWGMLYVGNAIGAVIWGAVYDSFGTYNVGLRFEPVIVGVICVILYVCIGMGKKTNEKAIAEGK